jgi:hypothetical protein
LELLRDVETIREAITIITIIIIILEEDGADGAQFGETVGSELMWWELPDCS